MVQMEGRDVVSYLTGWDSVRDGRLASLHMESADTDLTVRLLFHKEDASGMRVVELELRDIREFDYEYCSDSPTVIEFLKCLWTEEGHFYLSLDPYDEREDFISEQDNQCFRCGSVRLSSTGAAEPT